MKRFSEEQIIGLLQCNESGVTASQLCREIGISESSLPVEEQIRRDECQ